MEDAINHSSKPHLTISNHPIAFLTVYGTAGWKQEKFPCVWS